MNRQAIESKLIELKQQYSKLFRDLHRTSGAIEALEFALASTIDKSTEPDAKK